MASRRAGRGRARRGEEKICERRRKGGKEEGGDGKRGLGRSEAVVWSIGSEGCV